MKRRELLRALAAAAASGGILGCGPRGTSPPDPAGAPNILFVFPDQLRPDVLGPYGGRNIETPHIDALARGGLTFANALSTCPLCTPYRGMLFTGRYPTHSGMLLNRINASPRQNPHCLASLFEARGYDTGFLGKWHLSAGIKAVSERLGEDEAAVGAYKREHPDFEFTPPGPDRLGFRHWEAYNYHVDFRDYWFYRDTPQKIFTRRYETEVLVEQAKNYMERRRAEGRPFALFVAPHPPHPPFAPDHCPPGYLEQVSARLDWGDNVPPDTARSLNLQVRCYHAMVRHLDDCMGRLVRYLDESGLSETTLVVFTSDHGEMHGSHGLKGKMYPYAESVNVPLIMRWPGTIAAGRRTDELHTPLDHLPTFCSLAGVPTPAEADGVDFAELIRGGAGPGRDAVLLMNYVASFANFKTGGVRPEWRGVRTARHTYVRWLDGAEALFDNVEDPYQLHSLLEDGTLLEGLRERARELLARAHDEFLPGTAYAEWYETGRNLVRTALGPVA